MKRLVPLIGSAVLLVKRFEQITGAVEPRAPFADDRIGFRHGEVSRLPRRLPRCLAKTVVVPHPVGPSQAHPGYSPVSHRIEDHANGKRANAERGKEHHVTDTHFGPFVNRFRDSRPPPQSAPAERHSPTRARWA